MKNNNQHTRRRRGSSPPFQRTDQGIYGWEIGLRSTIQPSDESPYVQLLEQQEDQEEEWDEQESDARQHNDKQTGQDSFEEPEFRRNRDDENRWQDDGGESG